MNGALVPRPFQPKRSQEDGQPVTLICVHYHEAAEDESLHAIGYLELRAKGRGQRFYRDVRRAEDLIFQFAESATLILPGIRKPRVREVPPLAFLQHRARRKSSRLASSDCAEWLDASSSPLHALLLGSQRAALPPNTASV